MKKTTAAVAAAVILIACIFAACGGAESGKVSDPSHNDPVLTTLEEMVTEAMTDFEEMFSDGTTDSFSSSTVSTTA